MPTVPSLLQSWGHPSSAPDTFSQLHSHEHENFDQNQAWLAIVLHIAYLILMCIALPYVFVSSAHRDDNAFLPARLFLVGTTASSLILLLQFPKFRYIKPVSYSLVLYGTLSPYVSWVCHGDYMNTPAECWLWLTVSTFLGLHLGASHRLATAILLLQILSPVAGGLLDYFCGPGLDIHQLLARTVNIVVPNCTIFALLLFISKVLAFSRQQAELKHELGRSILRNILPAPIADQMMEELGSGNHFRIAQHYPTVTVCFCDIVGFTSLCLTTPPIALVETLNSIFSYFDRLCLLHGVEKIKTIGDAYMFTGFPAPEENPNEAAVAVIRVAVRMIQHMKDFHINDSRLEVRVGAHSGPVVAGVIGCTKFAYDIWGPTVNLASRLESNGKPSTIQVSVQTRDLIADVFPCDFRENRELKGAGSHDVYVVNTSAIPQTEESPDLLEGLGLSDIAHLVQEINRRQTEYLFSTNPATTVVRPSSPRSPMSSRSTHSIGRHSPRGRPATFRGFPTSIDATIVPPNLSFSPPFLDTSESPSSCLQLLNAKAIHVNSSRHAPFTDGMPGSLSFSRLLATSPSGNFPAEARACPTDMQLEAHFTSPKLLVNNAAASSPLAIPLTAEILDAVEAESIYEQTAEVDPGTSDGPQNTTRDTLDHQDSSVLPGVVDSCKHFSPAASPQRGLLGTFCRRSFCTSKSPSQGELLQHESEGSSCLSLVPSRVGSMNLGGLSEWRSPSPLLKHCPSVRRSSQRLNGASATVVVHAAPTPAPPLRPQGPLEPPDPNHPLQSQSPPRARAMLQQCNHSSVEWDEAAASDPLHPSNPSYHSPTRHHPLRITQSPSLDQHDSPTSRQLGRRQRICSMPSVNVQGLQSPISTPMGSPNQSRLGTSQSPTNPLAGRTSQHASPNAQRSRRPSLSPPPDAREEWKMQLVPPFMRHQTGAQKGATSPKEEPSPLLRRLSVRYSTPMTKQPQVPNPNA